MKTIFNTKNCYEGVLASNNEYMAGNISELYQSEKIKPDTISWSHTIYECEKDYFMECLQSLIQAYEKRYRTTVDSIGLVGRVGHWNGSPVGGRIIDVNQNPIEFMGSVDDVEVTVDKDGVIRIHGYHHDGSHCMNLYLLTENKLRKVTPDYLQYGDYNYRDMEVIYEQLKPLKMGKIGVEYYGFYSA
jgi:hypothetical protein